MTIQHLSVTDMSETQSILKKKIQYSFGVDEFSKNESLLFDEGCTHEECIFINNTFRKERWDKVAARINWFPDDIFYFFSAYAYHYYTPCFMCVILDHYYMLDVSVEAYLESLKPDEETKLLPLEKLNGLKIQFTEQQKETIAMFLRYMYQHYDEEIALEAFQFYGDI